MKEYDFRGGSGQNVKRSILNVCLIRLHFLLPFIVIINAVLFPIKWLKKLWTRSNMREEIWNIEYE